jgi:hypothetical protein
LFGKLAKVDLTKDPVPFCKYSSSLLVKFRTHVEHNEKNEFHLHLNWIKNIIVLHLLPNIARELTWHAALVANSDARSDRQ